MKRRQFIEQRATAAALAALPASVLASPAGQGAYYAGYSEDYTSTVQWTRVGDIVYCNVILRLTPGQAIAGFPT